MQKMCDNSAVYTEYTNSCRKDTTEKVNNKKMLYEIYSKAASFLFIL